MATPAIDTELQKTNAHTFALVMRSFMECSDEVQQAVKDMARIVSDPDADADEKSMALDTICEALFPCTHNGQLGADMIDLEEEVGETRSLAETLAELDREESAFAARVQSIMDSRNFTQVELASLSGVGQPAISMMLTRQCRPQRRTVEKLAKALGVPPDELWPTSK